MSQKERIAVVTGTRTPQTKAFTSQATLSAVDLGAHVVEEVIKKAGLAKADVDEVVMGNVSGPPDAANVARVIALTAGIPEDKVAHTVNRNCASGMESLLGGWQSISSGRADIVVAGGSESMSNIPLLFNKEATALWLKLARAKTMGQRLGIIASMRPRHFKPVIGVELGLTDPVSGLNMGETAEVLATDFGITRGQQDQFALESHQKGEAAQKKCFLSGEISPIEVRGETIDKDNAVRYGQTLEALAKLRPIFKRDGTVTPGNSCPLTDGAAAVVLAKEEHLDRFQLPPMGYISSYAIAGCDPKRMGLGPVYATAKLLKQTGMTLDDFDLIEINEAFAAQVIACDRAMESKSFAQEHLGQSEPVGSMPMDRVNIHGGAIALGHPVGTTGTRLILTLMRALKANGKQRGLATLCVGGGQGVAMVVEVE